MKLNYSFAKSFALFLTATFANLFYSQTYCNPTYSNSCSGWRITQVTIPLAGFDNTFASGTCTTGRDRTSVVANLNANTNYTINVSTMGWTGAGMAIDFNKDGDFDDAGEALFLPIYTDTPNQNITYTGNFTIPTSVAAGTYRMRVWNRLANAETDMVAPVASPCGAFKYGTWTDYTVNLAQLGTSEVTKSTAKIYPNPVSDVLTIEDTETIKSVEIYDFNGKLIKNESFKNSKTTSVKLSDLVPGTYNAKIIRDKGTQTIKFIKK